MNVGGHYWVTPIREGLARVLHYKRKDWVLNYIGGGEGLAWVQRKDWVLHYWGRGLGGLHY